MGLSHFEKSAHNEKGMGIDMKKQNKREKHSGRNIASLAALVVVLGVVLAVSLTMLYNFTIEYYFNNLEQVAEQIQDEVVSVYQQDLEHLAGIGRAVAKCDSPKSEEARNIICSFVHVGLIRDLAIVYPDDTIWTCSGNSLTAKGLVNYDMEVKKGTYLTGIREDIFGRRNGALYQFMPVAKDGVVEAVLLGVIPWEDLQGRFTVRAFGGKADLYICEGATGNLIVNNRTREPGNAVHIHGRKAAKGYLEERMLEDMGVGRPGNIIFRTESTGSLYYMHYQAIPISNWVVMLGIPESAVFQNSGEILWMLCLLVFLLVVVLLGYFAWVTFRIRKESQKREQHLKQIEFMFEIQKILFEAHSQEKKLELALEKIASTHTAEKAFLIIIDQDRIQHIYTWPQSQKFSILKEGERIDEFFPMLHQRIEKENHVLLRSITELKNTSTDWNSLKSWSVSNIMASLIRDLEGNTSGVLAVANMESCWEDAAQLDSVVLNFSMAINNMKSYQTIREMGTMDSLTGLLNRNSYQVALEKYSRCEQNSFACLYLDVNGLHEVNNCLGHAMGDEMLKYVAYGIRSEFGVKDSFRIGGDEFVIFCTDMDKHTVDEKAKRLRHIMEEKNYHISIGLEWKDTSIDINSMITEAEKKMYAAKRLYYKKKGDRAKAREMNQKLEEILLKKKDSETFLSVIAPYFKGVYIVDLEKDDTRSIYIPYYFERQLEENNGKFSAAFQMYIQEFVVEKNHEELSLLTDYNWLERKLLRDQAPVAHYHKRDGESLILHVYSTNEFRKGKKETIWLFETQRFK